MALFGNSDSSLEIVIRAKDEASKKLKEIGDQVENFADRNKTAVQASRAFALGLAGAGTALAAFGTMAIKAAADMEQTKVAFTTMLGSAEKADTFIRELIQF